jgi:hypothetical protein
MPITSADRDEARKILTDDYGVVESSQETVEKKAGEIASAREMKGRLSVRSGRAAGHGGSDGSGGSSLR